MRAISFQIIISNLLLCVVVSSFVRERDKIISFFWKKVFFFFPVNKARLSMVAKVIIETDEVNKRNEGCVLIN